MRNRGATSQNSVLFSTGHFRLRDIVRPCQIQLHKEIPRTPWLGRRACFRLCKTIRQPTERSKSADGG